MFIRLLSPLVAFLLVADPAAGCSYCSPNFQQRLTLRQNARLAKFIVYGTLKNPRLIGDKGATDFHVVSIVQHDPSLGERKVITIPAYIPFDAKSVPAYLIFGEMLKDRIDIAHSTQVGGPAVAEYLKAALAIDDADRAGLLQFCYKHLDSSDPDVARDAFHEFAKASDADVAAAAAKLAPDKLRRLLRDRDTPTERLGIFAYLLGACGEKSDADLLAAMIRRNDERGRNALGGLLGGLIELQPRQGWALVEQILKDPDRPFADKYAAIGTVRFHQTIRPKESRTEILACLAPVVDDADLADLAIEDLRRWQLWEATGLVLAQFGKKSHSAPITKRAIVRYALCSPRPEAVAFMKSIRASTPKLVEDVEESLEHERTNARKSIP